MSTRRTLAAALYLALAACGGKHATEQADAGASVYGLTLAGNANIVLHPGEKRTLQVLLSQDQIGPVVNGAVHFEFQDGDPAGAVLEAANVNTDSNGIATVHYTAGNTSNGRPTYKVVASAPNYDAAPVAFSFHVIAVLRQLDIVATPAVHVVDPQSATAAVGISSSTALRVRELDQDTGNPIAGDTITFTLPNSTFLKWSGATGATITAQTGAGGEAQVFLLSSQAPEGPIMVGGFSSAGGSAVSFSITVQAAAGSGSCTSNQQCSPGQTCIGGHCQDGGGGTGCDNGSDNPCPFGYLCVSGVCQPPSGGTCDPKAPNCANGQCCDPSTLACKNQCAALCVSGSHCDTGAPCGTGFCLPDGPGAPDVTGV